MWTLSSRSEISPVRCSLILLQGLMSTIELKFTEHLIRIGIYPSIKHLPQHQMPAANSFLPHTSNDSVKEVYASFPWWRDAKERVQSVQEQGLAHSHRRNARKRIRSRGHSLTAHSSCLSTGLQRPQGLKQQYPRTQI